MVFVQASELTAIFLCMFALCYFSSQFLLFNYLSNGQRLVCFPLYLVFEGFIFTLHTGFVLFDKFLSVIIYERDKTVNELVVVVAHVPFFQKALNLVD